jgi:Flp pilus assembly protein TadB
MHIDRLIINILEIFAYRNSGLRRKRYKSEREKVPLFSEIIHRTKTAGLSALLQMMYFAFTFPEPIKGKKKPAVIFSSIALILCNSFP